MADTCVPESSVDTPMDEVGKGVDKMDDVGVVSKVPRGLAGKLYWDPTSIRPPANLSDLISVLHDVFDGNDVCVEYVQRLMTSYVSNAQDWKKFAKFDKYKYTRNLVDEGNGKYNLMILCWNEGQGSGIHSHADAHCFLKVLSGTIKEEQYYWPEEEINGTAPPGGVDEDSDAYGDQTVMKKKNEMTFEKNQCAYINDSIGLHRVENNSHVDKAVTLHLYSPPFQECKCFDQRSGRVSTAKMTFWTKFGKRTPFGKNPEKMEPCSLMEDN